jgi:ribosomal protein S12 methylthiotransferase accessory factor
MNAEEKQYPLYFRQIRLSARKHKTGTNSHYYSEDQALAIAQKQAEKIGVTRLADVTGLDRIGIPVVNSIKPAVEGSCIQHGKGLTLKAAKISALMESLERHCARNAAVQSFFGTYNQVKEAHAVIPIDKMVHFKSSLFHADLSVYWTLGWDIMNQREVAAPLAAVELAGTKTIARNFSTGHFEFTSNGLAAGFTLIEAISQAIFEVVERDAITCNTFASHAAGSFFPLRKVELGSVKFPEINALLERFTRAGVQPGLFDCTVDTDIPTFNCYLLDERDPDFLLTHGMGADLDPVTAMARAMTEAAQTRAVFRSGARDFFFSEECEAVLTKRSAMFCRILSDIPASVDLSSRQPVLIEDYEKIIHLCLEKLKRLGLKQVVVFPLTKDEDIPVVRVLIPGLEGHLLSASRPGERAARYLKAATV